MNEEDEDYDRLVFPRDIYSKVQVSGKASTRDKVFLIVFVAIIIDIVLLVFIPKFTLATLHSSLIGVLLILIVNVLIGYFVILKRVLKIKDIENDSDNDNDEDISRFFKLVKTIHKECVIPMPYGKEVIPIYQYSDGPLMSCIRFRFGNNNPFLTRETDELVQSMLNTISHNELNFKTITMSDKYSISDEHDEFVNSITNPSNINLSRIMAEIATGIIEDADANSKVSSITLLITTKGPQDYYKLDRTLNILLNMIYETGGGFREANFLTFENFIKVAIQYYGVETIDLSMLKVLKPSQELIDNLYKVLKVCSFVDEDGNTKTDKKYINNTFKINSIKFND